MLDAQARGRRSFDSLISLRPSSSIVLSNLAQVQIPQIAQLARENIGPEIASEQTFENVLRHNRECSWVIYRRAGDDPFTHRLIGFTCFLLLNASGAEAVEGDAFVGRDPQLSMLCNSDEMPSALYWWATVAPSSFAQMVPAVVDALQSPRYRGLDIFTRGGTEHGARILGNMGFDPVMAGRTGVVGDLLVYRRLAHAALAA